MRVQIFHSFLNRYYPYTPPLEKTVANPQRDAARVAGWYQSSRRVQRALRLVYALGQTSVSANPDGTIEVTLLLSPAGDPQHWREVGPLYYRDVNGQGHLKFNTDSQGHIVSWTTDDFPPVEIFQRVSGLTSLGMLKPMLIVFVAILLISLLVRLGAWIARRNLKLRLGLSPVESWTHLAARIGAIVFLVALGGWIVVLSGGNSILDAAFVNQMIVLYALGVIAILGGLAIVAETVMRFTFGRRSSSGVRYLVLRRVRAGQLRDQLLDRVR